ncbi:MAG: Fe-S cluster assembly protein SufD [Bacteroidetes bacterium]|nr:Fe-S cluster assembly protein SufD [Bacteroidota bacterium]MBS1974665.1 Fe-S cluster assembly protein SufD [Bacteroidota bacterium]
MSFVENYKEHFEQLLSVKDKKELSGIRENAFNAFAEFGIPTSKHEEWKYTRIGALFNRPYRFLLDPSHAVTVADIDAFRLPGHQEANELIFVNGIFSSALSKIISKGLAVVPLEEAAADSRYKQLVAAHFGNSGHYLKDGINALNTALVNGAVFVQLTKGMAVGLPVYIYNINDARKENIFSQPRSLIHVTENAQLQIVETYFTLGVEESFTNQVMEIVVEENALLEYYKIQNDAGNANQVSTTHIRQAGRSYVHTVTVSLNGGIVRNNLNMILEAERCESHLYGLYFQKGKSHIDNHTVVDNVKPNCFSNELYKGVMNDESTGVFNGKIFVRQQAQKTNAFQSNKNILLSDDASVNTKPQLEIFADDVKCSHGCTVGQLDEEALFYLQSRGIGQKMARSLLIQAFASDILEHVKLAAIRKHVEHLVAERLEF